MFVLLLAEPNHPVFGPLEETRSFRERTGGAPSSPADRSSLTYSAWELPVGLAHSCPRHALHSRGNSKAADRRVLRDRLRPEIHRVCLTAQEWSLLDRSLLTACALALSLDLHHKP